jgi:Tfp pilus assembly protein PilO
MTTSRKATWIAGAVVVSLLMVVATWFLLASPVLATAGETNDQAASAEEQNRILEAQVETLKADFARIDEYRAELAGLRTQLPTDAELAPLLRELDAAAVAHSVALVDVQVQAPTAVAAPVAESTPAPAAEAATSGEGVSTEAPAEPAATPDAQSPQDAQAAVDSAVAAIVPAGLTAVPVSLTVVGTYDAVTAFLDDVQNRTTRLFLAATISATAQSQAESGGGRPATEPGDLELTVTGFAYALPDALATPDAASDAPSEVALPGAVPGKNPLVPVAGE